MSLDTPPSRREIQMDIIDHLAGYPAYELETAIERAVISLRERRAIQVRPNVTEKEEQRGMLNEMLRPYGWRVTSIPARKGVGYDAT